MAIYYGGTKTHAVLNVHYATDTGFGYTTNLYCKWCCN